MHSLTKKKKERHSLNQCKNKNKHDRVEWPMIQAELGLNGQIRVKFPFIRKIGPTPARLEQLASATKTTISSSVGDVTIG